MGVLSTPAGALALREAAAGGRRASSHDLQEPKGCLPQDEKAKDCFQAKDCCGGSYSPAN